jgi:hypothetical protein
MVSIETPVFTRQIAALVNEETYARLQRGLVIDPQLGDIVPGTSGLRKIRVSGASRAGGAGEGAVARDSQ